MTVHASARQIGRAHPWQASWPAGVRADAPIERTSLTRLLLNAEADYATRCALECRGVEMTYAELADRARGFAGALRRAGLGPGDTVALHLPNTCWHPIAFFGAMFAGCKVAHLSPLDPPRVLAHKLGDSEAKLVVGTDMPSSLMEATLGLVSAGAAPRAVICREAEFACPAEACGTIPRSEAVLDSDAFLAGAAPPPELHDADPDEIALLQYTGGTTGLPKGAMLSHGNLTASVSIFKVWLDRGDEDAPEREVVLCVLPLFHIYSLTVVLLRNLAMGSKILLRPRFDAAEALDDIEAHGATYFPGVPTMWIALTNQPDIDRRDLSSLRLVGSGGAPLPVEVGRRFHELTGLELGGGWGMTETCSPGTATPPGATTAKPGTIGTPLPGIEMKIVGLQDRADLAPGETGEIAIRGPNVTRGYWRREEATAEAFLGDWFLTGDVGFMDEDGFFWLVDRKGDMIISGGFNVYPQMVENAIYDHPAVSECSVIGIPDPYRGESAKAFVALRPGHEPFTLEALREFLDGRLGRHEMPRALEFRESLPRTPVGKLSRKALKDEEAAKAAG